MNRIADQIELIEKYVEELNSFLPSSFAEYQDLVTKAACERYIERLVESTTDLAFIFVKAQKWKFPQDDFDVFTILHEKKLISKGLSDNLKAAKGMRNIIAHQYATIDDEVVFEALSHHLIVDVKKLVSAIVSYKR